MQQDSVHAWCRGKTRSFFFSYFLMCVCVSMSLRPSVTASSHSLSHTLSPPTHDSSWQTIVCFFDERHVQAGRHFSHPAVVRHLCQSTARCTIVDDASRPEHSVDSDAYVWLWEKRPPYIHEVVDACSALRVVVQFCERRVVCASLQVNAFLVNAQMESRGSWTVSCPS